MSYSQVNSSAPMVGELSSGWFAGDHGPEGAWSSLKGSALTPMELSYCEQDKNYMDGRVEGNGMAPVPVGWTAYGPVTSGTFDPDSMTRGTDKNMPR